MEAALASVNAALVLQVLEATAVIASAIAGMIVASNKGMDLIGVFALACVNAFGGGTLRDVLLDNRPFYWMAHWWFFIAILAVTVPFVYSRKVFALTAEVHRRSVRMDAVGLALFTIAGTGIALSHHAPLFVAILMGVVTGTTGGVLRDVLVNDVPDLFRPGGLYATAAFSGATVFVVALATRLDYAEASVAGILTILGLRLISVRLGLAMPPPQWGAEGRHTDR